MGAGKATLSHMVTGHDAPDKGLMLVECATTIGFFSQDVGEMAGRSAAAEVMDGAGAVSAVAAELTQLDATPSSYVSAR
jgi:ATPase subunit of ABC transporter with duplicated ATPase domains